MKREDFKSVDGFEDAIKVLKTGICAKVECEECPFRRNNLTGEYSCAGIGYASAGIGWTKYDHKMAESAIEFEKLFILKENDMKFVKVKTVDGQEIEIDIEKFRELGLIRDFVDWSKVPVDTKILVRDNKKQEWQRRYFAEYEDGKVYCWDSGLTSFSAHDHVTVSSWNYTKLYKEGDNE